MRKLRGIIAPILTPFENDGSIADDLWIKHASWVLDQGAHYLSPFGTTGEALLLSVTERKTALDTLVKAGIPAEYLMPGTGVTSLKETIELTSHAVNSGCAAVMVLPSFFYTQSSEEGHFRYFSELISSVHHDELKICLYNIPQNSGVAITPELTARLCRAYPDTVVAYKDSSGSWDNTCNVISAAPSISLFPGSESFLVKGLSHNAAGCISATLNLNARAIRDVYEQMTAKNTITDLDFEIKTFREIIENAGLICAMKSVLAVSSDDMRWLNLRAPLLNAEYEDGVNILEQLGELAIHL